MSDGDNGLMLLRDQIVIQVGDEVDGMVMIRSGDNRQGVCPVKFLQEVWRFKLPHFNVMKVSSSNHSHIKISVFKFGNGASHNHTQGKYS